MSFLSYVLYTEYCPQISETKFESLCDESITTIKKREKQLIDGITKHSQKLQNEIELERKTVKKTFCDQNKHAIFVLCSVHGILSVIIFGCTS
jgi:hypothetical protein